MEETLFDEILEEIFTKLPSSSSSLPSFESIPLVSKRWLRLYRASKTSMSLRINPNDSSLITLLPSILHNYPSLSSLCFFFDPKFSIPNPSVSDDSESQSNFTNWVISIVSLYCLNLRNFSFLINPISSPSCLLSLSSSLSLTSLSLRLLRPVSFNWVSWFPSLKDLSIDVSSKNSSNFETGSSNPKPEITELGLESISLTGIQTDDTQITWLWRSCRKLKKLKLKSCETLGDIEFFSSCLNNLEEIEIRRCRSIIDVILLKLSAICGSLKSLLIHDGGNKDGIFHFMNNSKCYNTLQKLDFRLPMDLTDEHLIALAANFKSLTTLRLQSCYFVSSLSLKVLSLTFSSSLEELSLISCDAVGKESGLLVTLGQNLKRLKKLELCCNERLTDKELGLMLVNCNGLVDLNLRGCKNLTGEILVSLSKNCVKLRNLDVVNCGMMKCDEVMGFVMKAERLEKIVVEESQVTEEIMKWSKLIEVVGFKTEINDFD